MQPVSDQGQCRRSSTPRRLGKALASLSIAALALSSAFAGSEPATAAGPAASAAYVAVQPCRLADTRLSSGYTVVDALTLQVPSRGVCGVPAGATSLALILTVVGPQGSGFLTAWPASQARPTVSNVNFMANQVRANGSITRLDGNGAFRVYTSVPAQVVVDVVGAFVPATSASSGRFVARPSTRLFDSRGGAKFAPGSSFGVPLPSGVPQDAVALALNITVTESTGPGFVTEFPAGRQMPESSILNVDGAGQTRAAAGIFPASPSGVALFVSGGGHIVVDLLGYFTGPSAGAGTDGLFTAYDPTRLLDTRGVSPLGNGVPLYSGGGLELATSQGGSLAYNITAVDGNAGYITAYPAGADKPATSTVNSVGFGDVVANFAITQVSTRGLGLFTQAQTHAVVDLQGWFSGPSATTAQTPPVNVAPPVNAVPPASGPTFSTCVSAGLDTFNSTREAIGVAALATNANAQSFACASALQLAQANNGLVHSGSAARAAAIGCSAGENIALAGGSSPSLLISMWYNSAPHLANIQNAIYRSAGVAFVIRTEPNGYQSIWGVADFAVC